MLGYLDSVVGALQRGGLSHALAHSAIHVLGSRILGFTMDLFDPGDLGPMAAGTQPPATADRYPILAATFGDVRHDDDVEFEFGLNLILDGLERSRRDGAPA